MSSNSDLVIRVDNLGKCYHIYDRPRDRLKQAVFRGKKQYYREFWALRNVSFEVKKGESVAIIGRNGSGKSTLLQLICQTLEPTEGQVEVKGRVAALLELGAGFNPEFTGRENVYMNGAILGFSTEEMDRHFAAIEEFADIGSFIDQPVKTYSSGMFVRLAFAVQACVEPDVLIVDEALSVGDIFFQQKCAKRIRELRELGVTLIFVSHDMSLVRDLCDKAIHLQKGVVQYYGSSLLAIQHYFREDHVNEFLNSADATVQNKISKIDTENFIDHFKSEAFWVNPKIDVEPTQTAKIIAIAVLDNNDQPTSVTEMGDELKFKILYQVYNNQPLHLTLELKNRYDQVVNSSGSYTTSAELPHLSPGDYGVFELSFLTKLEAGSYTFSVSCGYVYASNNRGYVVDSTPSLGPIEIKWDYENQKAPWLGMFGLPCKSRFITYLTEE